MTAVMRHIEYLIFILAICMISMGFTGIYLKIFNMAPPLPALAIKLPILIAMLMVMVFRIPQVMTGSLSILPYFLLGVMGVISFKWSLRPDISMREGMVSLIVVVYLACMAWRYNWRQLVNGMWFALFGMVLLSFIVYLLFPSLATMDEIHVGAMSGLWIEKNTAGQIGVFGAGLALARFAISPKTLISSSASFLIFTLFLLLSTSKTALVAYVVGCGLFAWVFMMRRGTPIFMITSWLSLFLAIFLALFIQGNTELVLSTLGRSTTFTGRTEIWQALAISLQESPLLGHGFMAFWDTEDYMGTSLVYVYDELNYQPPHAHNSFVDMRLSLGYVGLSLLVISLIGYFLVSLMKIRSSHGAYFAIPFMASALIIGMFESVLAYPASFAGCIIILVAAKMTRPVLIMERQSGLAQTLNALARRANHLRTRAKTQADAFTYHSSSPVIAPHSARHANIGSSYMPPNANIPNTSYPIYSRRHALSTLPTVTGFRPSPQFNPAT